MCTGLDAPLPPFTLPDQYLTIIQKNAHIKITRCLIKA